MRAFPLVLFGALAGVLLGPTLATVVVSTAAPALGPAAVGVLGPAAGPVPAAVPALEPAAVAAEAADLRVEMRPPRLVLQAGGPPTQLVFTVLNDGPATASRPVATVRLPLGDRGVTVTGSRPACTQQRGRLVLSCALPALAAGTSADVTVTVAPPPAGSLAAGERLSESGSVGVTNPAGGDPDPGNDNSPFAVGVSAEAPVNGITQVTGQVQDGTAAQPVPNATVVVTDSAGNTGRTATDDNGRFVYNAAAGAPLVPGRLTITAFKDGFQESSTTVDASDGGAVGDVRLSVTPIPRAGSATPSAAGLVPVGDAGSGWSTLAVVLGSLVAIAVLASIAYWLFRNRDSESGPTSGRPNPASHPTIRLHLDGLVGPPEDAHPDAAGHRAGHDATAVLRRVHQDDRDDATAAHGLTPSPPRYRAPEDDTGPLPPEPSRRGRRAGRHSAEGRRRDH